MSVNKENIELERCAARTVGYDCLSVHTKGVSVAHRILIPAIDGHRVQGTVRVRVFRRFVLTYVPGELSKSRWSQWMRLVHDEESARAEKYSDRRKTVLNRDRVVL